jgi:tetratricopeptide (TPR) repeat protein
VAADAVNTAVEHSGTSLKTLRQKARDLNKDGEWGAEALEINAAIAELDPSDVPCRTRRARCFREQGDYEAAARAYEEALALDPENANIPQAIQEVRREAEESRVRELEEEREAARREAALDNLLTFDEALGFARKLKATAQLDLEYTIKAYRRALEHDPERLDVAVEMAALIRRSGSSLRALRIYDRVLEKRPDYDPALIGKAAALLDDGRVRGAVEICEMVLERTLYEPYARKVLARAHALLGQREESLWQWELSGAE